VTLKLLDCCCKAGGVTRGYQRAGFHVTGCDIEPQPRYIGDAFVLGDALDYLAAHGGEYDVIHASPDCRGYTRTNAKYRGNHPRLIGEFRAALQATGKPYIIENVEDARAFLHNPLMLCGSMFGLPIERHRYFEIEPMFRLSWGERLYCQHIKTPVLVTGVTRRKGEPRRENNAAECANGLGIDWMTRAEMDQAIPPAYTEYIGRQMLQLFEAH
jgi:DNA (cytosine-5)-methyltransferase 1